MLSEPTKSTRDWYRAHQAILGSFKGATKGLSHSKRKQAFERAVTLPNRQPQGPHARSRQTEVGK